jgi:predicted AlkP superfamily pyrophosphatase or phosphodiesterase
MRRSRIGSLPFLLLVLLSCRSAAPPGAPTADPRRVVLLSLDGASADELQRLWRAGVLTEEGFARFFRKGQVAERLVNINPTLTAPNHISLATGYPADQTGIVANAIHLPGTPLTETVRGFDHTIETETLWEAARRQGRRVAVNTFPGADGRGERRRADWGMVYVNDPDRPAELVELDRSRWEPAEGGGMQARVELSRGTPEAQTFELRAVSDELLTVEGRPLAPGAWGEVPCRLRDRDAVCLVKLLELDPTLQRVRLYFNGVYPLRAYPAGFAADLARRGLYWPGEPDGDRLSDSWAGRPGIDLETWLEQTLRFARFFGDSLLATAERPGWDLLMGYMPMIDEAGHQLYLVDRRQPGFSPERRAELERARHRVWQAVDREIARLLHALDLRNTVVVLVSDHGMAPVHTTIDPNVLLQERGLLVADRQGEVLTEGTVAYAVGSGGISHVYVEPGRRDLLPILRETFAGWTVEGEPIVERIVTREEASDLRLDHPNSGDLILMIRPGFNARGGLLAEGVPAAPSNAYGMHGYLNSYPEMHGIFLAVGAGIAPGSAGEVRTTEVAGRVADWLGMEKPRPRPVE